MARPNPNPRTRAWVAPLLRIALLSAILALPARARAQDFLRADCNGDGTSNIADAVYMLQYFFDETVSISPPCFDACDANDDGRVNLADPIFVLGFLKAGGMPPDDPWPGCGVDPTADSFDCVSYPLCP